MRCQVVLHAHRQHYALEVGAAGDQTLGSAFVKLSAGAIAQRRIDLRTDVEDPLAAALPHELCHLVLADRFRNGPPPLWLDEGAALQYDPPLKVFRHERDFRLGLASGLAFSAAELVALRDYPAGERRSVFYGQCGALVGQLLKLAPPEQLVKLAEHTADGGFNIALRELYGLDGAAHLDRILRSQPAPPASATPTPAMQISATFGAPDPAP
jgi:hypothetical protein